MFRFARPASSVLAAFTIVAIVAGVCWPGVHGFWGRDDFMQLAAARLVGSPWPLFVQDAYVPAPGAVFRPLGFVSFWLGTAVFGTNYAAHIIGDLTLHAGVALALFGVLRSVAIPRWLAALCCLLFAVHPAVVGTALWWSARFDLLAALFTLLSLRAAFAYREQGRTIALAFALVCALAAMLCKEVGLAVLAPLSWLWGCWAWQAPALRARALRAVVLVWLCAVVYFGWRWCALGTFSSDLTGSLPITHALAKGLLDWVQQAPGYLSFGVQIGGLRGAVLLLAIVAILGVVKFSPASHSGVKPHARRLDLAVCGFCLVVVPALLQAPVAALNAVPLRADMSAVEAAMQSRLYYLSLAGTAALLAALLAQCWQAAMSYWRVALVVPLAAAVIALGSVSHTDARAFARRSVQISGVARAAIEAVDRLDLPPSRCHVVFLGVEPAPEWSIFVSMDSVMKALSPDLARVAHCYFHTDYVTYFHLLAATRDAADAAPWGPLHIDGAVVPSRRIGDLAIDYLTPPAPVDTREFASMRFLRYRDGRFDEVSAQVLAGTLAVRLQ